MSPELFKKWENLIEDVEKTKIPVEFIKKLVLKLHGRKRKTINIQLLLKQGLDHSEIEEVVSRNLDEMNDEMIGIDFVLDIKNIAEMVQPETDKILKDL